VGRLAGREDLEAAEAVEEEGEGAEVGVFPHRGAAVGWGLGRRFDEADLVAGRGGEAVERGEGCWREVQVGV